MHLKGTGMTATQAESGPSWESRLSFILAHFEWGVRGFFLGQGGDVEHNREFCFLGSFMMITLRVEIAMAIGTAMGESSEPILQQVDLFCNPFQCESKLSSW